MSASADVDLLTLVREGDQHALATLYDLHRDAALRFARGLVTDPNLAEDLVADAFERVLRQVREGRGPQANFRAYLFTAVRNRYVDEVRRSARLTPVSDQPWVLEGEEVADPVDDLFDEDAATAALAQLPDSWRRVLWHVEVEGRPLADAAALLALSPTAASSLAHRAREGLKLAYLDHQLATRAADRSCQWSLARLSQYVRGGLSPRAADKVQAHVAACASCTAALAGLEDTNRRLAALLLPIVMVGATLGAAGGGAGGPSAPSANPSATAARTGARGVRTGARTAGRTAGRLRGLSAASPAVVGGGAAAAALVAVLSVAAAVAWWPAGSDEPALVEPSADQERPGAVPDEPTETAGIPAVAQPTPDSTPSAPAPSATPETPVTTPAAAAQAHQMARAAQVRPSAPVAVPITACGAWGRLDLPSTTGVRYRLSEGDGRSGPWEVTAAARSGFTLAPGVATSFRGDLGSHRACPEIGALGRTSTSATAFDTTLDVTATDPGPYQVGVELRYDATVYTLGFSGAGWQCWATDGSTRAPLDGSQYQLQPGAQWVLCELAYQGTDPGPLTVSLDTIVAADATGTARVTRDGQATASGSF
ncbi:sigma-70 family RNA polymerase sigma factor [Nocardioides sp. R1-1]|uniref:sigma-70 family RNA polymerase sigma factor n=1 Tax=Nocardioides sp. R1-1 TaxID=3383502 RepID=UPI0038D11D75